MILIMVNFCKAKLIERSWMECTNASYVLAARPLVLLIGNSWLSYFVHDIQVECWYIFGTCSFDASFPLGWRLKRSNDKGAFGRVRWCFQALPLPHHHELLKYLSEGTQPRQGHCSIEEKSKFRFFCINFWFPLGSSKSLNTRAPCSEQISHSEVKGWSGNWLYLLSFDELVNCSNQNEWRKSRLEQCY